ncbi:hypothetical protein GCM10009574_066140 [Streptomyces asiaticus]|uniref:Uncharacterized protein n=2 Tax=Streptomyces rhizosphaericus TaxID=114699 RepID=A0ABN1PEH5_9ACTN
MTAVAIQYSHRIDLRGGVTPPTEAGPFASRNNEIIAPVVDEFAAGSFTDSAGLEPDFRLYRPEGFVRNPQTRTRYPLVVTLYGGGEVADNNMTQPTSNRIAVTFAKGEATRGVRGCHAHGRLGRRGRHGEDHATRSRPPVHRSAAESGSRPHAAVTHGPGNSGSVGAVSAPGNPLSGRNSGRFFFLPRSESSPPALDVSPGSPIRHLNSVHQRHELFRLKSSNTFVGEESAWSSIGHRYDVAAEAGCAARP